MKLRSQRLTIVVERAQQAEQEAAQALQQAQQLLLDDRAKLEELQEYVAEYQVSSVPNKAFNPSLLERNRNFIHQLFEAITQQQQQLVHRQALVDQKKQDWNKLYLKLKALNEFVAKIKNEEEKVLSKKEEKMLDEWFAQSQFGKPCSIFE